MCAVLSLEVLFVLLTDVFFVLDFKSFKDILFILRISPKTSDSMSPSRFPKTRKVQYLPSQLLHEMKIKCRQKRIRDMRFLNNVPIFVIRQTIFTLMACSNNVDLETWRTVKQQGSLFCCTRVIHSCGFLSGSN